MVTKAEITEAAFYLFGEMGFYKTSMEDIAKALGLKKQSLYSHFSNKNDIVLSVVRNYVENIEAELDRLFSFFRHETADKQLKLLFMGFTLYMSHRERLLVWKRLSLERNALKNVISESVAELLTGHRTVFERCMSGLLFEILSGLSSDLRENPDKIQGVFKIFMGFVDGYLDLVLIHGYSSETAESLWNIFWNGVKVVYGL